MIILLLELFLLSKEKKNSNSKNCISSIFSLSADIFFEINKLRTCSQISISNTYDMGHSFFYISSRQNCFGWSIRPEASIITLIGDQIIHFSSEACFYSVFTVLIVICYTIRYCHNIDAKISGFSLVVTDLYILSL